MTTDMAASTLKARRAADQDSGVTLIIMAISLVALMAFAGLVIDGGRAYAERRQMQNAADASSMAGTRELDEIRTSIMDDEPLNDLDADAIYAAAAAAAASNGADLGADFECYIVDETGALVTGNQATSRCPEPDGDPATPLPGGVAAAGVEVISRSTEQTFLIKVLGQESFTARAGATAQVQGLREVDKLQTPFMLCAYARGTTEGPDILVPNGASWDTNPAAVWKPAPEGVDSSGNNLPGGPWYIVHGPNNEDVPGCGSDSQAFKGLVSDADQWELPGDWFATGGTRSGPTRSILSDPDACANGDLDDCIIIVPMCVGGGGNGGGGPPGGSYMECIRFGAFRIFDTSNGNSGNRHHVALLGDADVILGEGQGGGAPALGELRVIKLTK